MESVTLALAAVPLVALAVYAQVRIPRYTAGRGRVLFTRLMLAAIGIAFGVVATVLYPVDPANALLAFLAGFGAVHFPAALILFFKGASHAQKS